MTNKDLLKVFCIVVLGEAICHWPVKKVKARKMEKYYKNEKKFNDTLVGRK